MRSLTPTANNPKPTWAVAQSFVARAELAPHTFHSSVSGSIRYFLSPRDPTEAIWLNKLDVSIRKALPPTIQTVGQVTLDKTLKMVLLPTYNVMKINIFLINEG